MNRVPVRKILGNTATPAEKAEFEAWISEKPLEPTLPRPTRKQALMPFGIGIPLIFMGGLIGMVLMVLCVAFWNVNEIVAFLIFIATIFAFSMVLPVGCVVIADEIYSKRYCREMHDTGWDAFEYALSEWRQEGSKKFETIAQEDFLINIRLGLHLDFD